MALQVIQSSSKGEDPAKANAYSSVAAWLAQHHDFEHALELARLIQGAKPYSGQTNTPVYTLLWIQPEQLRASDQAGAQETIDEVLAAADQPVDSTAPAFYYISIASQLAHQGNRPAATAVVDRIHHLFSAARSDVVTWPVARHSHGNAVAMRTEFQALLSMAVQTQSGERSIEPTRQQRQSGASSKLP